MYEKITTKSGANFLTRIGSSDIKAINEVVVENRYERRESRKFLFPAFRIESGEKWIDVGGNIGAFAVHCMLKGASVESYEPDPDNFSLLETNIAMNLQEATKINPSAVANSYCVGLHDGPISSAVMSRNSARGNYWRNSVHKNWRGGELIKINMIPFESVIGKRPFDICVKIDAEGSEMPILEAYGQIRFKKLVFEWSFDIDPDIRRFQKVIKIIRKTYSKVFYPKFDESHDAWNPSWFPACKTVWAI